MKWRKEGKRKRITLVYPTFCTHPYSVLSTAWWFQLTPLGSQAFPFPAFLLPFMVPKKLFWLFTGKSLIAVGNTMGLNGAPITLLSLVSAPNLSSLSLTHSFHPGINKLCCQNCSWNWCAYAKTKLMFQSFGFFSKKKKKIHISSVISGPAKFFILSLHILHPTFSWVAHMKTADSKCMVHFEQE